MNEFYKRYREHKFKHEKGCQFEKQIKSFDFNGMEIQLRDDDYDIIAQLRVKYCPYCGFDIDAAAAQILIKEQRKNELIEASPIKLGDIIWVKQPNNDYWKGRGLISVVSKIEYHEIFDRLLYQNYSNERYAFGSYIIDEIELYTDQPILNTQSKN